MCKCIAYGMCSASMFYKTVKVQLCELCVHSVQPGMVTTDLLMSGATTKQAKFFINILAEPPDVVRDLSLSCISLCIVYFFSFHVSKHGITH